MERGVARSGIAFRRALQSHCGANRFGEAFWLRTYQAAINGMRVEAVGLTSFESR